MQHERPEGIRTAASDRPGVVGGEGVDVIEEGLLAVTHAVGEGRFGPVDTVPMVEDRRRGPAGVVGGLGAHQPPIGATGEGHAAVFGPGPLVRCDADTPSRPVPVTKDRSGGGKPSVVGTTAGPHVACGHRGGLAQEGIGKIGLLGNGEHGPGDAVPVLCPQRGAIEPVVGPADHPHVVLGHRPDAEHLVGGSCGRILDRPDAHVLWCGLGGQRDQADQRHGHQDE